MALNLANLEASPDPVADDAVVSSPRKSANRDAAGRSGPSWLARLNQIELHASKRVGVAELVLFTQQLALLLGTGNSIAPSIGAMASQMRSPIFRQTLERVHARLEEGIPLSDCLKQHPKVFDALYISIVRAGEASGALRESLDRLAHMLEVERQVKARIREAMTYPMVLTVIMFAVVLFMVFYMVPRFEDIFAEIGDELPLSTRCLLGGMQFLRSRWWLAIPILVAAAFTVRRVLTSQAVARVWDRLKLKLPLVGRLFYGAYLYRLFSSLGLLLSSHVPHLEAIDIARHSVRNERFQELFDRLREQVEAGRGVAAAFLEVRFLPEAVQLMISTGEASGALDTVMARLSERYREELESDIRRLSTLIEPVMLVAMGVAVGFIAVSFIMPLFKLSRAVH